MGTLTVRPLRPAEDAPMIHTWVTQPRGRFWGMADKSVTEVREIYDFVDSLEAHWAWVVEDSGRPAALLQTYEPEHDPVADAYHVRPGDLGVHIFIAPGADARSLGRAILRHLFTDPGVQRLVGEPDASNRAVLAHLSALGFELGDEVTIGEKTARMAFLTRPELP